MILGIAAEIGTIRTRFDSDTDPDNDLVQPEKCSPARGTSPDAISFVLRLACSGQPVSLWRQVLFVQPARKLIELVFAASWRVEQGPDVEGAQHRLAVRVCRLFGGTDVDGDPLALIPTVARFEPVPRIARDVQTLDSQAPQALQGFGDQGGPR
jgi:hypothetical protein